MFEILQIDTVHGNLQHYNSQITLFFHIGRIEGEVEGRGGGGGREKGETGTEMGFRTRRNGRNLY